MVNLDDFDASTVEPLTEMEVLPPGDYVAVIIESVMKATRAGDGNYLELTFQILEGDYMNRLLWDRLNLDHPNEKAVAFAQARLSSICRAVGVMKVDDSQELHNIPLVIAVRCKKREDTGDLTNEIRGYYPRASSTQSTPPATTDPIPWKK